MAKDHRTFDLITGMIIGGAIGAITALLYAPKSGRETREEVGEKVEDIYGRAKEEYDDTLKKARQSYEKTVSRIKDFETDAKQKAEEVEGMMDDLVGKGKESVEQSKGRLREAIDSARRVFKEESQKEEQV
ncbi:YtxH domain-containing protein, partial [Candidatus Saccharibacteria bacterium]|nr:YtxH domain-containing protein [Candidatus Saccharibacteria bacterium]NIW79084.1 hypothetical protein [Calditrichia bacterium]